MDNFELINIAASVIKVTKREGVLMGDVGCALITEEDHLFTGVCAATGSNVSCAETNAIGAMLTAGVYKIKKIVAVWKNEQDDIFVISPCGNCRQLMKEVHPDNLSYTNIVLGKESTVLLKEMLPYHDLWQKI